MTMRPKESSLTEENTEKIYQGQGWTIRYHEAGQGEPLILMHAYGPGSSGWLHFHKVLPMLSRHFRCIILDRPGYTRTVAPKGVLNRAHDLSALAALTLMDGLGITKAHVAGFSGGGLTSMLFGIHYPDRTLKVVTGSCHHSGGQSYGGEPYMMAIRPSEGNRASEEAVSHPTRENFVRYLKVHIDDEELVTDELVDYVHQAYMNNPSRPKTPPPLKSRREQQAGRDPSTNSHLHELPSLKAPTLIIYGRYDRMCAYELGLTILNYVPDSRFVLLHNCGHWPPFEKPEAYAAEVISFLKPELVLAARENMERASR